MKIDQALNPSALSASLARLFELAGRKANLVARTWDPARGAPVFTVKGQYSARGWTEWTQGFQFGIPILAFEATDDRELLELGCGNTVKYMAPHVTHIGVHDHGFNNLSTYGNLRRLMREGRIAANEWEMAFYEMALKCSGAVQAARWADVQDGLGFVYSFNGPQSLFIDTMRTIRILGVAHQLGHALMGENDRRINLLGRSIVHALTTSRFIIYYGSSGATYDVRGRTAHEGLFNRNDGRFRARSTQQGYSPFSTWTRGLAWAMLGYAEELEFLRTLDDAAIFEACGQSKADVLTVFEQAARATCDHYIDDATALDGVPYWDDGAPGLWRLAAWRERNADPYNDFEPVDSSAAAIAAQGLIRLGRYLGAGEGQKYFQAGLTVARTLLGAPYLSEAADHQGLLLHSVYHRPNNWDYIPPDHKIPCGESSLWGDYHLVELGLLIKRIAENKPYYTFWG